MADITRRSFIKRAAAVVGVAVVGPSIAAKVVEAVPEKKPIELVPGFEQLPRSWEDYQWAYDELQRWFPKVFYAETDFGRYFSLAVSNGLKDDKQKRFSFYVRCGRFDMNEIRQPKAMLEEHMSYIEGLFGWPRHQDRRIGDA